MWTYEKSLAPAPAGSPYRAFVWMQGHNYSNFALPNVQQMLLRAIAWAGKRPIDTLMTERPQRGGGAERHGALKPQAGARRRRVRTSKVSASVASDAGIGPVARISPHDRSPDPGLTDPDIELIRCPTRNESTDRRPGSARLDKDGFIHRSWVGRGLPEGIFDGRPIIGICNTWSELTPCNAHFRELAEHVKRGVWEAGGFPFEFPVMSLGETSLRPTAMLFRNLASMDVEESIRGNPIDGVVLLCGCDKTTPALVMGAASCDLPAIVVSGGPMLNGKFRGKPTSARAPTSGASARRSRPAR